MKTLLRDRKVVYYALRTGSAKQYDAYGNYTGEDAPTYGTPTKYDRLSAQLPKGSIALKAFGLADEYTETYATHDMNCPIQMDTILWVDALPTDGNGNAVPHTHVVKAILPTVNAIRIVLENVSVS